MAEDTRQLVGQNVRIIRLAAGISQAELATRIGVDRAYVSGLEQGNRNPTVVTLWHLAKALKVPMQSFFDERNGNRRGIDQSCLPGAPDIA
jgi:transcriptional regulator with XRE-family HTH domain